MLFNMILYVKQLLKLAYILYLWNKIGSTLQFFFSYGQICKIYYAYIAKISNTSNLYVRWMQCLIGNSYIILNNSKTVLLNDIKKKVFWEMCPPLNLFKKKGLKRAANKPLGQ